MGRASAPLRREGGRTAAPQAAPDDAFDGKAFVLQQLGSELSSQGVLFLAVRLVYVRDNAHARFPALAPGSTAQRLFPSERAFPAPEACSNNPDRLRE